MKILKKEKRNGRLHYWCRCKCGKEKWFLASNVDKAKSKSCGCLRVEVTIARNYKHGMSHTSTHNIWMSMLQRCDDEKHKHYQDYGGRGIKVCKRWYVFTNFLQDMGERPDSLSIERNNNDKGYSPTNCRWATQIEQGRNRRNNVYIEYKGETKLLIEWCKELGVRYGTAYMRIKNGRQPFGE